MDGANSKGNSKEFLEICISVACEKNSILNSKVDDIFFMPGITVLYLLKVLITHLQIWTYPANAGVRSPFPPPGLAPGQGAYRRGQCSVSCSCCWARADHVAMLWN